MAIAPDTLRMAGVGTLVVAGSVAATVAVQAMLRRDPGAAPGPEPDPLRPSGDPVTATPTPSSATPAAAATGPSPAAPSPTAAGPAPGAAQPSAAAGAETLAAPVPAPRVPTPAAPGRAPAVPPGPVISRVTTDRPLVALTFDDGPGPLTDAIVAKLAEHGVPATFYVQGVNAAHQGERLRRMHDAGHVIANHSWSHADLTTLSDDQLHAELARTSDLIEGATGVRPDTFRSPYGARNGHVDAVAGSLGMRNVLWDIDTVDWKLPGPGAISASVAQATAGSIILMHDAGGDRAQTLASLDQSITELKQRFQLVTVPELIAAGQPT
jgi:peptidoglycan-N-acetylglucosamine deacetylase